jgi:hypothetical protein
MAGRSKSKYTEQTRRAIHEFADKGVGATEIALRLREGRAGVPAIDVPRRTVAHIAAQERQRAEIPEGAVVLELGSGYEEAYRRAREAIEAAEEAWRAERGEYEIWRAAQNLKFLLRENGEPFVSMIGTPTKDSALPAARKSRYTGRWARYDLVSGQSIFFALDMAKPGEDGRWRTWDSAAVTS